MARPSHADHLSPAPTKFIHIRFKNDDGEYTSVMRPLITTRPPPPRPDRRNPLFQLQLKTNGESSASKKEEKSSAFLDNGREEEGKATTINKKRKSEESMEKTVREGLMPDGWHEKRARAVRRLLQASYPGSSLPATITLHLSNDCSS